LKKLDITGDEEINFKIEKLGKLFPNVVEKVKDEEGSIRQVIDFEKLREELGDTVVKSDSKRYLLTWPGREEALTIANSPADKMLRPIKEDSLNWEATENIYIEGDNLETLKLLQKSHAGKIKFIYIDPPYNTGKDFIYKDKFILGKEEYARKAGKTRGEDDTQNADRDGRYHSSWLTMIYPRLKVARGLLKNDGVIFISIDDKEEYNLRKICNEIFGEKNFIANFIWRKSKGSGNDSKYVIIETEYILAYAKNVEDVRFNNKEIDAYDGKFKYKDEHFKERGGYKLEKLDRGSKGYVESMDFGIKAPDGTLVFPNGRTKQSNDGWRWVWSKAKVEWGIKNGYIVVKKGRGGRWNVYNKVYEKLDNKGNKITRTKPYKNHIGFEESILNIHANREMRKLFGKAVFSFPKPVALLKYLLKMFYLENEIVLDFFSGSATTAHAVMELNAEDGGCRKYIMVQLPEPCDEKSEAYKAGYETIAEIGKERIRRAGKKIKEETGADIDYGFRVYRVDSLNTPRFFL